MIISYYIRITVIRLIILFYIGERIRTIFYDDMHIKNKYNNMSTPIELFIKHINIVRQGWVISNIKSIF